MDRPALYIETSIVSYLASDLSRHPVSLRNQQLTHAWWNTRRHKYELFTSADVIDEAARGDVLSAKRRLALLAPVPLLESTLVSRLLADELLRKIPLPEHAKPDASHIAIAAVQQMAYLLTWDTKHIANPRLGHRIERICTSWGFATPILCTPATLQGE
jgi:hypothetical protein